MQDVSLKTGPFKDTENMAPYQLNSVYIFNYHILQLVFPTDRSKSASEFDETIVML